MSQKSINGFAVLSLRVQEKNYDYVRNLARKYTWGKMAKAVALCLDYCEANEEGFKKYIKDLQLD